MGRNCYGQQERVKVNFVSIHVRSAYPKFTQELGEFSAKALRPI